MRISLVGGGAGTDSALELAERVGETVASRGHTLVCGGRGGVMEAGCRGAKAADGTTVGILPGVDTADVNPYIDIPIVTGLGNARNVLVAINGDGVVAIDGRYGTLSEIAHALDAGRPVAGLDTHDVDGLEPVDSPVDAVDYIERRADGRFDE